MKKILLFTFSLLTFNLSFGQITCSPKYVNGCNAMGIDQVIIDSSTTLKFNSSIFSAGCQNASTGFSDFTSNSAVSDLCKGNTYTFTIKGHSKGFTAQYAAIYIDYNGNNSFADPGEFISIQNAIYMDYITFVDIYIPTDAQIGKSTIRIMTSSTASAPLTQDDYCNGNLQDGETEDFLINIKEAPMRIVSTTTNAIPNGTFVQAGDINKYVLQVQVVAKNSFSPLNATNFEFTTNGTNKISSIKNAKLWYSGLDGYNNYFYTQVGSDIPNPNGTFNITGNQPLVEGTNYFWLTYDIADDAVPGDILKATSEKTTINSNTFTPNITFPPTEGLIVDYCTNSFENSCEASQSPNSNNIKDISIGNLKKTNIYCANNNNYYPPIYNETLTIYQGGNTGYGIKNGDNKRFYAIFIDYNNDGKYTGTNEFNDLGQVDPLVNISGSIKTPIDAIAGVHRLRILCSDNQITNDLFCLKSLIGESHDYTVQIYAPYEMAIRNAYYYKEGNLIAPIPSTNNEILKFKITVNGSSNPISVKKLIFNTNNTDVINIENAKVWFGGIIDNLSAATQVGTIITNPSGEFSIDADVKLLDESSNYFWLTYDIPTKAKENNSLNASIVSVTDNNGKEIKIAEDKNYSTYPQNILGTRKTAGSVAMKDTTIVTCNSTFYDDGGINGVYSSNKYTTTFKADTPNSKIKITFNKLTLGFDQILDHEDQIDIFNGATVDYSYINTSLNQYQFNNNNGPLEINTDSSAITIFFNGQAPEAGWEAVVSCVYDCNIDPLRFNTIAEDVICGNEFHKTTIKITDGGSFPPFRYIIKDNYNNLISFKETNDDNLISFLKQGSYQINVENSKGCNQNSELNISDKIGNPINYLSYNTYTDILPTCNIANDGVIKLSPKFYNDLYQTGITFEWNEVGKADVYTSDSIPNVKYFIKYHIKSSVGGICRTDTIYMKPEYGEFSNNYFNPDNDTANALIANEKPIISDLNFTIGKIKTSNVNLIPTKEYYNCYDCYPSKTLLPDSIHWLISPNIAANINPGDTISSAIWNTNFSGIVKIKAEPFKGVCRGSISPEETVIIKPLGELKTSNSITIFKGDSTQIVLNLKGTKPYTLTYRLPSAKNLTTITNITTDTVVIFAKSVGTYVIKSLFDADGIEQILDTSITVEFDGPTNLNAVVETPKCHLDKVNVEFTFTGGKAPYQIFLAKYISSDELGLESILSKDSLVKTNHLDTTLSYGRYQYYVKDASGITSSNYILKIVDTIAVLVAPKFSKSPATVEVNSGTIKFDIASIGANAVAGADTYKWFSSNEGLVKTTSNSSVATFSLTPNKSGQSLIRAIALDTNNCPGDTSAPAILNITPTLHILNSDQTIFYNSKDSLTLEFVGTKPWYAIINNNGTNDTIKTIQNSTLKYAINKGGKYYIIDAKDSLGLQFSNISDTVNIVLDTITNVSITSTDPACAGKKGRINVNTVSGGKAPYKYFYYQSTKPLNPSSNNDTTLLAGTYNVSVIDAAGFEIQTPKVITLNNSSGSISGPVISQPTSVKQITVDTLTTNVMCSTLAGITKYGWVITPSIAGTIADSSNSSTITWANNFSGNVTLTAIGVTAEGCISDSSNHVSVERTGILNNISIDKTTIYNGDSATISVNFIGSAPFNLCYTINNTSKCITGITSSTYDLKIGSSANLIITSANDASNLPLTIVNSTNFNIILDTITAIQINKTDPVCAGKKGRINVTSVTGGKAPYKYFYYQSTKPLKPSSNNDTTLLAGTYNVSVIDAAGFEIQSPSVITLNNSQGSITGPVISQPTSVKQITVDTLTSNVTCSALAGITKYGWVISPSIAGTIADSSNVSTITWANNFSGKVTLTAIGVTSEGCISDSSNHVLIERVGELSNISIDKLKITIGDSATITATFVGSAPFKLCYTIANNSNCISGITTSTYDFKIGQAGKLGIISISDAYSLAMSDMATYDINISIDTLTSTITTAIKDAACSLEKGQISFKFNGGLAPYKAIITDVINSVTDSIAALSDNDPISLKVGTYNIKFKDATGFISSWSTNETIKIAANSFETLMPTIQSNTTNNSITNAAGAATTLTGNITSTSSSLIYNWQLAPISGGIFTNTQSKNTSIQWDKRFSGIDTVKLFLQDGLCVSDTAKILIKVKSSVVVTQVNNVIDIKTFGRGPFNIFVTENTVSNNFISQGDTTITLKNISFITAIDLSTNDTTSINQEFTVSPPATLPIKIFDAFSPNGDSINDYFVVQNMDSTSTSSLKIVDELGFEVFKSEGPQYKNNWNGVNKSGDELLPGIYFCIFTYNKEEPISKIIEIRR